MAIKKQAITPLSELSELERKYLYCATQQFRQYRYYHTSPDYILSYSRAESNKVQKKLVKAGYLSEDDARISYTLNLRRDLLTLITVYGITKDWQLWSSIRKALQSHKTSQSDVSTMIELLYQEDSLSSGDAQKLQDLLQTPACWDSLVLSLPMVRGDVTAEQALKAAQRMPENRYADLHKDIWSICAYNDIEPPTMLLEMMTQQLKISILTRARMLETHALYNYLLTGDYKAPPRAITECGLALQGIRNLYEGRYDEAFKKLNKSVRMATENFVTAEKGFFPNPPLNYFLAIAYARPGTPLSQRSLSALTKKSGFQTWTYIPEYFLTAALADPTRPPGWETLRNVNTQGALKILKVLRHHFNLDQLELPDTEAPVWAWLREELSPWADEKESAEWGDIMGGPPLLASLSIAQPWEALLDEIETEISAKDTLKKKSKPKEQLVYIIEDKKWVMVKRRKWLEKSDRWGSPTNVSQSKFITGDMEYPEEVDAVIGRTAYRRGSYSYMDVVDVLPLLIGSDRVFTAAMKPVQVVEKPLTLSVQETSDGYTIDSIAFEDNYSDAVTSVAVFYKSPTLYEIVSLTPEQKALLEKLGRIRKYPRKASEKLRSVLVKLTSEIDIKSPLVSEVKTRNVKGDPGMKLRVKPVAGGFEGQVMVRPAQECDTVFLPGEGKSSYTDIDKTTNECLKVTRQLHEEQKRYEKFTSMLDLLEIPSDNMTLTLSPADMLSIVDETIADPTLAVIEWAEGKPMRVLQQPEAKQWNIGLSSGAGGWFEVEGEVKVNDDVTIPLARLLKMLGASEGNFIKLNDTDYLRLSSALRKQLRRLEGLTVNERGKLTIATCKAQLIEDNLDGGITLAHDTTLDELRRRIKAANDTDPAIPLTLQASLRPYQEDGYKWMERLTSWGAGACLADDMGLGKTVQTITLLLAHSQEGPSLVLAPASVITNWEKEIRRFAPTLNPVLLNHSMDRSATINAAGPTDIIISSYGLLPSLNETITAPKWNVIALDEAHVIKNRDTRTSEVAMQLKGKRKVILTGTPLQNRLSELWNLFRFINPGLLGSYEHFRQQYIIPIESNDDRERRAHLQRLVRPFMLRRTKGEVVEELPDKTEITLNVEMSAEETATYEAMRSKAVEMLEQEQKLNVNTLSLITRLREAACSSRLVDKESKGPGSKVEAFMDLLQEVLDSNGRMLAFSQFTSMLAIVREELDKAAIPYLYLDGSTSIAKRRKLVEEFQSGKYPLFLISLRAGGLGLNLTAANCVVHLDPWWNPAIQQQATDRSYRIGQEKAVTVYHLISQGTIEEKMLRLHASKRDLADAILEGTDTGHALTASEMLEIIS